MLKLFSQDPNWLHSSKVLEEPLGDAALGELRPRAGESGYRVGQRLAIDVGLIVLGLPVAG